MCLYVLGVYRCPQTSEGIRSPGTRVTGSGEPLCGCREQRPGPLQQQEIPLATDRSLQLLLEFSICYYKKFKFLRNRENPLQWYTHGILFQSDVVRAVSGLVWHAAFSLRLWALKGLVPWGSGEPCPWSVFEWVFWIAWSAVLHCSSGWAEQQVPLGLCFNSQTAFLTEAPCASEVVDSRYHISFYFYRISPKA